MVDESQSLTQRTPHNKLSNQQISAYTIAILSVYYLFSRYSIVTEDSNDYEFAEGYTRPVGGQQHSSPQLAAEGSVDEFEVVDPEYGTGVDWQQALLSTVGTPEHNPQRRAEPVTGREYTTLEMPTGGSNGVNEYNPYENEEGSPTHQDGVAATGNKQ